MHTPFSSFPGYGCTRIFWGCHLNECLAHFDCAALQVVLFLQRIYGFTVFDYSYGGMVLYRSLASSAIETASNIVHLCRHFVDEGSYAKLIVCNALHKRISCSASNYRVVVSSHVLFCFFGAVL
jgi:hypothetical protein